MSIGFLLRGRTNRHSALPAIERHMRVVVHDYSAVHINVCNLRRVYVHHRSVIKESSVPPLAAIKAVPAISESIVDPAIKTNLRTPVAAVPGINSVIPAPVSRRPQ